MAETAKPAYELLIADREKAKNVVFNADGTSGIDSRVVGGKIVYDVWAVLDGERCLLVTTEFPDISSHVYDSHDGTIRPWDARYLPRGFNDTPGEGAPSKEMRVFAIGETVASVLNAFADSLGYGPDLVEVTDSGSSGGRWEARASIGGTGFRLGGPIVPGGYVLTDRN